MVKTKGAEQMKKLVLAVGAVLSVGAAFAASYNVSTYDELTNALVSVVQSGDEVVIAASDEPYVLAKALTIPAGVTVRGATGNFNDVVLSGGGVCSGLTLTQGTSASVQTVISNLTITTCVSAGGTAGLKVNKWAMAENCRVTDCWATAQQGGDGVHGVGVNLLANGTLKRCVIDGNRTLDTYDGIKAVGLYASGTVTDTVITNNYAPKMRANDGNWMGAAGVCADGGATFTRCYFANNRIGATSKGANTLGIAFHATSYVYLYNCTFEQNNYESAIADNLYAVTLTAHANTKMQKCVLIGNRQADGAVNNVIINSTYADANYVDNASDGVAATLESKVAIAVTEDDFVRVGGFLRPKPGSPASGLGAMPDWDGVTPADPVHVPSTNLVSDITLLQAAIDAAKPGDVVQIAKGNYTVTAQIVVTNGVIVEGATGNRDDVVLDGNNACRVANVKGATLRHVTLTRGMVAGAACGGDAYLGVGGRLENCRATGILNYNKSNLAKGVAVHNNGGYVTGCLIDGNTVSAQLVRSIGYHQVCGAIDRTVIKDNRGTGLKLSDGYYPGHAGFWIEYGGSMRNCIVTGNSQGNVANPGYSSCGGQLGGAGSKMINCLVYNNTYSGVAGASVRGVNVDATASIVNSVILDNGHSDTKAENFVGDARHKNNVTDKATADLCTDSFTGTIEGLFLQTGDDLDIKAGSDLVDVGLAQRLAEQGVDFYGRPRLGGERIDIGPFEYHMPPFAVTFESPIYSALDKLETTLTATAVGDTEGTVYSWFLDDGEEPFSTGVDKQSVPLVITEFGTHTVTLKAVNGAGLADEFSQSYKVQRGTFVVNPGESIAAAIAEAEPGATVLLKTGVHTNAAAIVVNKAIALRGESREETVITGTNKVRGVSLTAAGATLADLTVTDCYSAGFRAAGVGVILSVGTVMSNCVVRNCKSGNSDFGVGVYCNDGKIYDSVITNNEGGCGTGFYLTGPSSFMCRTFVCGNKTGSRVGGDGYYPLGAGGVLDGGEVRDSVIAHNVTTVGNWNTWANCCCSASGVFLTGGRIVNCTVVENTHTTPVNKTENDFEGLIGGVGRSGGTVVNCLIAENYNTSTGGMVRADIAVAKNSSKSGYSTTCASPLELMPADAGNVSSVPGPVYRYSKRLGEYRLTQGSPCAGAGTWQTWMADAPDIYGRAWNPDRVDIGAAVYDCKGLLLMVK